MITRRGLITKGTMFATALAASGNPTILSSSVPRFMFGSAGASEQDKNINGSNSLRKHAQNHNLIFGSAVIVKNLQNDHQYSNIIKKQCGIVVPTRELKWVALRPSREQYDFSASDYLLSFAKHNHMLMRGHTLCWHESVPNWIKAEKDKLCVRRLFIEHITKVCTHYSGKLHSWDVVNEAILPKDNQPGGLRKSFWYEQLGPDYIELAFRTARAADPYAKLTYNDYDVELDNNEHEERRCLILKLLRNLKERNVPLDAVGIQSHIKAAQNSIFGKGLLNYIESIRQLGMEVYLTELDVNEDDISSNDIAQRDALIAKTYKDYLHVALANPAVKLVITWDISDRFTWLNDGPTHHRKQPNRPQRSLPFDNNYHPKEAFFLLRKSFDER
jgi:endo-1,4-beta-xylanase